MVSQRSYDYQFIPTWLQKVMSFWVRESFLRPDPMAAPKGVIGSRTFGKAWMVEWSDPITGWMESISELGRGLTGLSSVVVLLHLGLFALPALSIQFFYGSYHGEHHGGEGGQLHRLRLYNNDRITRVTGRSGIGPGAGVDQLTFHTKKWVIVFIFLN